MEKHKNTEKYLFTSPFGEAVIKLNVIFNKPLLNPHFYLKVIPFCQHLVFSHSYSGSVFLQVCRWQHEINALTFSVYFSDRNVKICI